MITAHILSVFSHWPYAMTSGSGTRWKRLKIRPSSFDGTLYDALAKAEWTLQLFFVPCIFQPLFSRKRLKIKGIHLQKN
jgi:hypothetical protein